MRICVFSSLKLFLLSSLLYANPNLPNQGFAIVTASSLNLRSQADLSSAILGSFHKGDTVFVQKLEASFALIEHNSSPGYLSLGYLEFLPEESSSKRESKRISDKTYGVILLSIPLIFLIAWLGVYFSSKTLHKLSSVNKLTPSFSFIPDNQTSGDRFYKYLIKNCLGNNPHPYVSYWLYTTYYFILIPFVVLWIPLTFDLLGYFKDLEKFGNYHMDYPIVYSWILLIVIGPLFFYSLKAINILKQYPNRSEKKALLIGLLLSPSIILVTALFSSKAIFSLASYLFKVAILVLGVIFAVLRGVFTGGSSRSRWLTHINGDDRDDLPYL